MAIIKDTVELMINGNPIPSPLRSGYSVEVITFVNAGRNLNGTTTGEVIGRNQYKITCKWNALEAEQYQFLLSLVKSFYFKLTFLNPENNDYDTKTFYVGNRKAEPQFLLGKNGGVRYDNVTMNFIDAGIQND